MGHGFLYDVRVGFEATPNSRVVEVIEHEASPRCVQCWNASSFLFTNTRAIALILLTARSSS